MEEKAKRKSTRKVDETKRQIKVLEKAVESLTKKVEELESQKSEAADEPKAGFVLDVVESTAGKMYIRASNDNWYQLVTGHFRYPIYLEHVRTAPPIRTKLS